MVENPGVRLDRLAGDCTVLIQAEDIRRGSGFFVAPGLIITCANVVAGLDGTAAKRVLVEWKGLSLAGRVRAAPPEGREAALWPYPDLCAIELDDPPPDHPSVVLGELNREIGLQVSLFGFTSVYDAAVANLEVAIGLLEGRMEIGGGTVWRVAHCEITRLNS